MPYKNGDIGIVNHLTVRNGSYFHKLFKCFDILDGGFVSNFFAKIDFHISLQSVRSIIYHIMARNHTILDSLVYLEICNLLPSQRDDSLVHSLLEFMETKFDFPMKFGNLGTDLIKFS